jgi:hypothetical protein
VVVVKTLKMVQGLHTASIRVGLDLNIFNKLVDADRPLALDELAESTGADPVLLGEYGYDRSPGESPNMMF